MTEAQNTKFTSGPCEKANFMIWNLKEPHDSTNFKSKKINSILKIYNTKEEILHK